MEQAEEIIKKLIDSGKINGEEAIILIKAIQHNNVNKDNIIYQPYHTPISEPMKWTCKNSQTTTSTRNYYENDRDNDGVYGFHE